MALTADDLRDTSMHGVCDEHAGGAAIIRDAFARIGDKWSLLILGMLDSGPQRFTALRDAVPGISNRMLTRTLRNLERDGLVSRTIYAEVPPRVEYDLTELGATILPAVLALANWALDHSEQIRLNRDAFDDRADA
jgi:DNA-binding HxlR family transcriptional regulator